ncbi:hypothetical protein P7K49_025265, partial [Saguinus oedipus]
MAWNCQNRGLRRFQGSAGRTLLQLNCEHLSVPHRLRWPAVGVNASRGAGVLAQTPCVSSGRSRASSSGPTQEALPSLQGQLKRTQPPPPPPPPPSPGPTQQAPLSLQGHLRSTQLTSQSHRAGAAIPTGIPGEDPVSSSSGPTWETPLLLQGHLGTVPREDPVSSSSGAIGETVASGPPKLPEE